MTADTKKQESAAAPRWVPGWAIGPLFFVLAAWFLWGADFETIPNAPTPHVDRADISTEPRRTPLGDPPRVEVNGQVRTCMDCHRIFPSGSDAPRTLEQHKNIKLHHGPNIKCSTCHDWDDRDRLVRSDGTSILFANVVSQCAQCHVSTHLDWKDGVHGRTNGYWQATRGERRRLICTECHDPHDPSYPAMSPMAPLPGPNTLRLSRGEEDGH
ncbi:MAG: hypothetical protein KDB53_16620 [Planctomycetes bacterium]|nr:hypothetical protein [Planctomycetota bacterium]